MADQIARPLDFYAGVKGGEDLFPNNILLFMRREELALGVSVRQRSNHHRAVLILALHGSGYVCADSENHFLSQGDALLVFPFQFHHYADVKGFSWLFITFEMEAFDTLEPLRDTGPRTLGVLEALLAKEVVSGWIDESHRPLLGRHLGLLLERLARLPAQKEGLPLQQEFDPSGRTQLLARVNSFALPMIAEEGVAFDIQTLAQRMNISESHLRAQFKKLTGRSLGHHLRKLRIQKACSLLRVTHLPITDVALQSGFDSVYSFSRAFRAMRGVTPSEYRKGISPSL